jgi:hypothetical protein
MNSVKHNVDAIYMMFLRLILSLGEVGALLNSEDSAGRAYGEGSWRAEGLAVALVVVGTGSVGSTREWKAGSARCGTLAGAGCGRE